MVTLVIAMLLGAPAEKPVKPLPVLAKEPSIDGALKELSPAFDVKVPKFEADATALTAKAALFKDTLVLGVTAADDAFNEHDQLVVTLYFPDSGTTSRGFVYEVGKAGFRAPNAEFGPPAFAQALAKSAVSANDKSVTFELAFPARALPRFQAFKPLVVSICLEYHDVDVAGRDPVKTVTCPTGEMVGGPTRLPDSFRTAAKLQPAADVEGIEARPTGWVGYSKLHYPTWAVGDAELTPQSLAELIAFDTAIDPASVALPLPRKLQLGDRPLFTLLTGKNPYTKDACNPANELRLALYLVNGAVATRALEWPAATCALGRAMRFELDADSGQLEIGYTNGQTARFVWTAEHFERSELGRAFLFFRSRRS